ncbi:hypothetical protein DGG96_18945 [Legionella qingyii]|uniref:Uncharacterized protein n=1 Tax=Legionella qingyii TaxID=2184757 RepID=A0A317TYB7_9GAMM|nr:hypothetical protein [Legionella qingyii]PWY54018.1 hypothetical protein DGG96_19135 [Legionella qingyii]PWY54078.1 hypothetical protein DGG96_18945 [Legionella qingyii]RUR19886.1 hypothetical protein ELY20_15310 [Legionella qingyii]
MRIESYIRKGFLFGKSVGGKFLRKIFGSPGEYLGIFFGGSIGLFSGLVVAFIDLLKRSIEKVADLLNDYSNYIGSNPFFWIGWDSPDDYFTKGLNIIYGTIGLLMALPLFIITKPLDYLFDLKDTTSQATLFLTCGVSFFIAVPLIIFSYPIKFLSEGFVTIYEWCHKEFIHLAADSYKNQLSENMSYRELMKSMESQDIDKPEYKEKSGKPKKLARTLCSLYQDDVYRQTINADAELRIYVKTIVKSYYLKHHGMFPKDKKDDQSKGQELIENSIPVMTTEVR